MKRILMMVILFVAMIINAAPYVTNVVAKQRSPWGIVDISCEVAGIEGTAKGIAFVVEAVLPDSVVKKVSSVHFRGDGNQAGLSVTMNGNYQFVWNANADLGTARYTNVIMRVSLIRTMVQLWDGGPYWATTNIGAEKPEDYGYYFWWGDTVGYKRENNRWVASDGSNSNFSFSSNTPTYDKTTSTLQSEGWITADGVLALEHDAAHVHWGDDWRMPTEDELSALYNNCDWTWTTLNGVNGYIVKGRGAYASNSIFLPAAGEGSRTSLYDSGSEGYYRSSVPGSYRQYAWSLGFDSSNHGTDDRYSYFGQSVRPVLGFTK